jgi:HEAT repeat protein
MPDFQSLMKQTYKHPGAIEEIEPLMVDFLLSDATPAGKQYVCRELGLIGTRSSIPALSELLLNPGMAGTSLLALEKIPGREADQALLKALEDGDDRLQLAVINSLAARQVMEAINPLARRIYSQNEKIALSAIFALGTIGGNRAASILGDYIQKAPAFLKWSAMDAFLKCANGMLEEGDTENAEKIYEEVFKADPPLTLRYNALAGKFKTSSGDSYQFILDHLRQEDPDFHPQIVQLIYQLDDSHELGRIFEDLQGSENIPTSHLITALASIGDHSVRPRVLASLVPGKEKKEIRMTAIRALAVIGEPEDALLLADQAAALTGQDKEVARQSLYMLPGGHTNEIILSGIQDKTGAARTELIRSTGERNMVDATGLLFELASDPDGKVRMEAIRALGKLVSPENLSGLVSVHVQTGNRRERQEAERAIFAVTQKMPDTADRTALIINELKKTKNPEIQASLVNIIGLISDGKDLNILREYLKSGEEEVQLAVIRAFSGWPDASPMKDLQVLASSTEDQRKHTLALRGYVAVVGADNKMSPDEKLTEIRYAYELSASTAEEKIVISGLSRIGSLKALEMAVELQGDPAVKGEAEAAIVRIADQTSWEFPEETARHLISVLGKIENETVEQRINMILERIH